MVWIAIAVLIAGLCCVPVGIAAGYGEQGISVRIAAGWFRIVLFPAKKKKPGKTKEKTPAQPPQKKKKTSDKPDSGGSLTDFLPLVPKVLDFLNAFRRMIRIDDLYIRLILAGGDPSAIAVNYGRAQAIIFSLQPMLERLVVVKKRDIEIECSFTATETKAVAGVTITITIGYALAIAAVHGMRILFEFLKIRKKRKGGKNNESEAS